MSPVDASTTAVDAAALAIPVVLSLIASAALYVWVALALSAVFRKSGEEAWKAWVPILNTIVLLQLGALSPWLVLVGLVPFLGLLALWVVVVIACYRINVTFGYGAGMTVLAALLFPVWATVLGFGSARWLGAEHAGGARRSSTGGDLLVPGYSPAAVGPPPPLPTATAAAAAAAPAATSGGWAPTSSLPARPAPPVPFPSATAPASAGGHEPDAAAQPISFVPSLSPSTPANPSATPARASTPDTEPAPPLPTPATSARANQGWGGFDLGAVGELTDEVTGAVRGAPQPIAAVPDVSMVDSVPSVTRVPAARPAADAEPWAPARSPLPEPDAFPEASGEVSAVAGVPQAGVPRSARTSVSAQHVLPEIPDDVEETVIASRRKAHWSIVLPSGSPVDLVADVVLVGRRPAASTAYPNAQLVVVDDGTVSKTHLRLERHAEQWSVTDLHSTNGTILISSDGAEREIVPGASHRAPARLLLGDAELQLVPDDASR